MDSKTIEYSRMVALAARRRTLRPEDAVNYCGDTLPLLIQQMEFLDSACAQLSSIIDGMAHAVQAFRAPPPTPAEQSSDGLPFRLLKPSEVCSMLSLSDRGLSELTKSGRIPCVVIGKSRRYRVEDVRAFADTMARMATPEDAVMEVGQDD